MQFNISHLFAYNLDDFKYSYLNAIDSQLQLSDPFKIK